MAGNGALLCHSDRPASARSKRRAAVVTRESCRVPGKREEARIKMEFKGTRRKWLKEGGIESRAYRNRSRANAQSKERNESQSKDGSGQQEAETARKLRL